MGKSINVITRTKGGTVTNDSRAQIELRTGVKVPHKATVERVEQLLAAKNVTTVVMTWAQAGVRQRNAAAKAAEQLAAKQATG